MNLGALLISPSHSAIITNLGAIRSEMWASLVAQTVKNLPVIQETGVRSLGQEGPLEKEMATHSSIFAWKIPWMEDPGGIQSLVSRNQT